MPSALTPARQARIEGMYRDGATYAEIMADTGCGSSTISRVVREARITRCGQGSNGGTARLAEVPSQCTGCDRTLIRGTKWDKASHAQKVAWQAAEAVRHHGRGYCSACYSRAKAGKPLAGVSDTIDPGAIRVESRNKRIEQAVQHEAAGMRLEHIVAALDVHETTARAYLASDYADEVRKRLALAGSDLGLPECCAWWPSKHGIQRVICETGEHGRKRQEDAA